MLSCPPAIIILGDLNNDDNANIFDIVLSVENVLSPMMGSPYQLYAADINMDISTISRATNGKYIQLPWGCIELKSFFSEGVLTKVNKLISNTVLKSVIKDIIKNEIKDFFNSIFFVEDGFVEGGDILNIGNHFIIGLSDRTNKLGADKLSNILKRLGATVEICKTPKDILHFKSECSVLDNDTILVSNKMVQLDYLKSNYNLIELPIGEEGASNSLRINDKLLLPDGFVQAEDCLLYTSDAADE